MIGLIYHAFDTSNGKAYVGQSWGALEKRKVEHLKNKSTTSLLANALRKRPNDFVWTVLTTAGTQEELNQAEIYFGELFNCLVPDGYCLKLGMGRGRVSEETRGRMRAVQQKRTLETRAKLSVSLQGNTNGSSNKGRKRPEHEKKLIAQRTSEAMKKWWAERKG